jgi:Flp pilus assembly protein TadD
MIEHRFNPPVPAWLLAALLAVVTMVLYLPVVGHEFVGYDDPLYVTSNHQVQTGLTLKNVGWAFTTGTAANWHPLTWLSLMLDVNVYGTKAAGFHITNVFLHAMDAVLLFWLLWRLTGAYWRSAAVAALFAWHPLHVESVAWVSERKDVLSAGFGFLTLLCYERFTRTHGRRAKLFYGGSLLMFALGLMSKPMLVTWPGVLLLLDYWPLERFKTNGVWPLVKEKIPFLSLSVVASIVTFLVQRQGGAVVPEELLPLGARVGNALISYCRYLGKIFWPADLAILYTHSGYWPLRLMLLAGIFLAALTALFWHHREHQPFLLVGWLWFLGTLVPVIGLVQVGEQAMADRYAYLPSVGVFIIVVWGVYELAKYWRRLPALSVLAAVTMVACLAVTRHQLGYWRNGETLFRHALAVGEHSYTVHGNLGAALLEQGQTDEAITQLQEALQLKPKEALAHADLGVAFTRKGQTAAAISQLQQAIQIKPEYEEAHYSLGIALLNASQANEAIDQFQAALRLDPADAEAHNKLGLTLATQGQNALAISHYQEALRLKPDYADAHYNLGTALIGQGQIDAAMSEFREAIRLAPDYAPAHNNLGIVLTQKGRTDEAIFEFEEALRLEPNYAKAQSNLAKVLAMKDHSAPRTTGSPK